ncbi:MAG: DUF3160 domain-containing protein [Ignavibacteria bacterium]|nr:DUF3160 domain-containing protein [Ignavibacteria bacterium]
MKDIDGMITFLVGESDNVTTKNLAEVQGEAGFASPDKLLDKAVFDAFTAALLRKPFAEQRINSQILMSDPSDPEQLKPPSAFLLLGQRFIVDSYVFGNVVFDRILKDGRKVMRMLPQPMDALFAIGNDASAQLLQEEMQRWSYAPNLSALRYLIDSYGGDFWNASLYNTWLHGVRALNPPASLEKYPAFMRTAAWWQEKMNTQLASWSQLRHDNLLYAKQSYTGGPSCSYPEGYVEPFPDMYGRLADFARNAGVKYHAAGLENISRHFQSMAGTMDTLQAIAGKELAGDALSAQDVAFIRSMLYTFSNGCTTGYGGWYQRLFFNREINEANYVVADVHTAPTDAAGNPVGWVLHVGTGSVNMGFAIAPSQQGGLIVYTGAMMSYYEHVTTNFKRMTDKEWEKSMRPSVPYPRPDWVNLYLADINGSRRQAGPALVTGIEELPVTAPSSASASMLHPVYPNPVTSSSAGMISFTVTETAPTPVALDVYDMVGRRVRSLVKATVTKGTFVARWDGADDRGTALPVGSYVVRFSSGLSVSSRMVTLAR